MSGNANFDVEAQRSLLQGEDDRETSGMSSNNARLRFRQVFLLIRYTELFKLAASDARDIISSSTGYASISSSDHIPPITQDSETAAAPEIPADSSERDVISAPSHPASDNIELQRVQRKNIAEIVKKKDLQDLHNFGGVQGGAEALDTDLDTGLSTSSIPQEPCSRKPTQPSQVLVTLFHSFLEACNNYTIFLLSCAAFLSLGFGINEEGLHMGWLNGAILMFIVIVLVICGTIQKCWEEWSSQKKLESSWQSKGRTIPVLVIRAGKSQVVRELDLEVGDIVVLRKGDQVPADGLFVRGEALELDFGLLNSITIDKRNPFLSYGSRVINGEATMLVTSIGVDTAWGEMMSQAIESAEDKCKFVSCLDKLSTCIHVTGLLISILIIIALFLRYKAGNLDDERRFRPDSKSEPPRLTTIMDAIKEIITASRGTARVLTLLLSVSLLGIMDCMVFVITLATICWNRKTLAHKASERDYLACLKMASVNVICTDKFGELTENEMLIDKFYVGEEFIRESSVVASHVLEGLCDGIGTLFLIHPSGCESKVIPLMSWADAKLGMKSESLREKCEILWHRGCNPFQDLCKVAMRRNGNEGYYLHWKGPPRDVLSWCSRCYGKDGKIHEIDELKMRKFEHAIGYMLAEEAEVIAYACERVNQEFDEASVESNRLIFLGMISLKRTKMEVTRTAVPTLKKGGVTTILVSGDNVEMLERIGQNYGLLTPGSGDLVITGEQFRAWTDAERNENVENIRIMGNCLPSDRILHIKSLREKGKVVAQLGQRTTDAPALKQADIGLTYGTWSSEVAIENSDINIWSGDFSFLVDLIENGRCFQENIQKFIQLELIVTISSSSINFIATVFLGDAPITAVQLFWLNLVVSFVGGLALLSTPSAQTLMTTEAVKSSAKLISTDMWRNIAIQASYQITIFVTLQHKGDAILGTSGGRGKSVIYNGFFLCQVFNIFIGREPQRMNIFGGLFRKNWWFWVGLVLFLTCQAVFAVAEWVIGSSPGLNWKLWGVCLLIAVMSWVLDWGGKIASKLTVAVVSWLLDWGGKIASKLTVWWLKIRVENGN